LEFGSCDSDAIQIAITSTREIVISSDTDQLLELLKEKWYEVKWLYNSEAFYGDTTQTLTITSAQLTGMLNYRAAYFTCDIEPKILAFTKIIHNGKTIFQMWKRASFPMEVM